jgi:hypothetical protein
MIPGTTLEKLQTLTEPKLQLASYWQALAPPQAPRPGRATGRANARPMTGSAKSGIGVTFTPGIASLIRATKAPLDGDSAQIYAPLSILL